MNWQERAACRDDDPREWDEYGTGHAHYVCRQMCPVRDECLAAAIAEEPLGQMRAGVPFGVARQPRSEVAIEHEKWWEMHLSGMNYSQIAREVGRHHTSVMMAIRRLEAVS